MYKMNQERSDKESDASGKKRVPEASTTSEALLYKKNPGRSSREVDASSKKRAQEASTPSEAERSKKAKLPQYIYILLYTEGGPYSEVTSETIGVYSSKTLALQNAKVAFEDRSNGFYKNGEFTEPDIFDDADDDNTESIGDDGVVFFF